MSNKTKKALAAIVFVAMASPALAAADMYKMNENYKLTCPDPEFEIVAHKPGQTIFEKVQNYIDEHAGESSATIYIDDPTYTEGNR